MICKKCGQTFEDSFNNCPNCGESVKSKKKEKKPIFKKWWFWLIIALVLVVIIGSSSGGDKTDTTTENNAVQTTVQSADADATAENETQEKVTEADDGYLRVGDVLDASGLEISYVSAEEWTDYDQFTGPANGNIIIKLCFDVTNNATTDRVVSEYEFECYADGSAAEMYIWGNDSMSLNLSSGRKGSGAVYFEVPADAEKIEVEYEVNMWSSKKAIFLVELP